MEDYKYMCESETIFGPCPRQARYQVYYPQEGGYCFVCEYHAREELNTPSHGDLYDLDGLCIEELPEIQSGKMVQR